MKPRLEDLASMALFAEVVQRRSFSAAAREVGLAKSAVSKRISQLEDRIGVRLLTRTTRKLSLTFEGVRYYEHCASLLAAARAAESAVAGASTTARGTLRINAPVSFAHMFLADAVVELVRRHPELEVQLSTDDRIVDVVEGGFDVAIRITRLTDSSLIARRLASDRLVVCGAPAYFDHHGRPAAPTELVGHRCLHYSVLAHDTAWRFRGPGGPVVVPVQCSVTSSDGTTVRHAAVAGLGIAVLPLYIVAADVAAGRLELVLEGARRAEFGIHAVFASRRQLPARTKLLLDHLSAWFGADDWRLRAHRSS